MSALERAQAYLTLAPDPIPAHWGNVQLIRDLCEALERGVEQHSEVLDGIDYALDIAMSYGGTDGDRHKAWVIDQMVRGLTMCPSERVEATDSNGINYEYEDRVASARYTEWVRIACDGEDGPDTYEWDEGIAP